MTSNLAASCRSWPIRPGNVVGHLALGFPVRRFPDLLGHVAGLAFFSRLHGLALVPIAQQIVTLAEFCGGRHNLVAIQTEIRLAEERRFHRLMREILGRIFIGTIHRLIAEFVFRLRRLLRAIDLLDEMTLRASHAIERGVAGLRLSHEELCLIGKLTNVWRMTTKTERLVFSCRRRKVRIQGSSEGWRMDRPREGRGLPLFEHPLMAAFTFARTGKCFFNRALGLGILSQALLNTITRQRDEEHRCAQDESPDHPSRFFTVALSSAHPTLHAVRHQAE